MKYEGSFLNGKRHGQGVTTTPEGETFTCEYKDNIENGKVTKTKKDGYLFIGRYLNGKTHGVSKTV